jgi:hypothetical protein
MGLAVTFDMSSANSSNVLSVSRLKDDGSNWVDYKAKAKMALGLKGLLWHIEGTAVAPVPSALEAGAVVLRPGVLATEDEIEVREKKINDFEQKEYMARHIIQSTVSPRVAALIRLKTTSEMWTIVKLNATEKSDMYKVEAHHKLQEM